MLFFGKWNRGEIVPNRIIKESITTSETIDQLSLGAEVFFYRLIVSCDDFGRMDARPPILLAKCFPLRVGRVKHSDIHSWLKELSTARLVVLYANGHEYLQVTTWDKHQRKRANFSKYPAPDDEGIHLLSNDSEPPTNDCHMLLEKRETRNEKRETRNEKREYGDCVTLTPDEHQKLIDAFGESGTAQRIERLSLYKGSTGKKYKSDYLTILSWEQRDQGKTIFVQPARRQGKSFAMNRLAEMAQEAAENETD